MSAVPTFADRVRGVSKLKRPTCLNFKTKSDLKRHEIVELLEDMKFPTSKIIGSADMKGRSVDAKCKIRENVLELFEKLKHIDTIYNLRLYETSNINILIGWVPIPMANETIQNFIGQNYEKAIKIADKKHRDGLRSGMIILVMSKNNIESKPIPSYINVEDFELYVTYPGQLLTCKYRHEVGHEQSDCEKRLADYPSFNNCQQVSSGLVQSYFTQATKNSLPSHQRSPLNLTKKRKFYEGSSDSVNTPNENNETEENCSVNVPMNASVEELQLPITQ